MLSLVDFDSGGLVDSYLFLSAGGDKKAEAGAGAATEFQFVSIADFINLSKKNKTHKTCDRSRTLNSHLDPINGRKLSLTCAVIKVFFL